MRSLLAAAALCALIYGMVAVVVEAFSPGRAELLLVFVECAAAMMAAPGLRSLREDLGRLSPRELGSTVLLAALFSTEVFWGMALPGFIYQIPLVAPFAVMLTSYLPKAFIFGAAVGMAAKPGVPTLFFGIWCLVSELVYPSPAWIPYYLAWGGVLDAYIRMSAGEEGGRLWAGCLGALFGVAGWGLTKIFEVVLWGNWHPLRLVALAMTLNALFTLVGFSAGFKLGRRLTTVTR